MAVGWEPARRVRRYFWALETRVQALAHYRQRGIDPWPLVDGAEVVSEMTEMVMEMVIEMVD